MRRIRVVVASPRDVAPERQIVSTIADELNHSLGIEKDFAIDVYRWELDSGLGIHLHGMQGMIDEDLPIESCDIMVAIFGVRFGSEILTSSETGTEHEITRAFNAWKKSGKPQVFVYFKNSAVRLSEIDLNQGLKLKAFKNSLHKGGQFEQCGFAEFETSHDFERQLRLHFSVYLRRHFPTISPAIADHGTKQEYPGENQLSQRQIAAFSVEAVFDGHVPLREVDCVISCLEQAVKEGLRLLRPDANEREASGGGSHLSPFQREVLSFAEPTLLAPFGTSVTVIWELPHGAEMRKQEMALCLLILDFVGFVQRHFRENLRKLGPPFAVYFSKVNLRSAVSSGKASKRKSLLGSVIDYVGTPVDEVVELRRAPKAGGFAANMKFAPYLLMERMCAGEGRRDCKRLEGRNEGCPIWLTDKPLKRRVSKKQPLESLDALLQWADSPYEDVQAAVSPAGHFSLTEHDVIWVFEIRERWESQFAADLARRVWAIPAEYELLKPIELTIDQMGALEARPNLAEDEEWRHCGTQFHSQIAELSDEIEYAKRKKLTEWVYRFTKPVYSYGMVEPGKPSRSEGPLVVQEHREILDLIKRGNSDRVGEMIREHLEDHYRRAVVALLSCTSALHRAPSE